MSGSAYQPSTKGLPALAGAHASGVGGVRSGGGGAASPSAPASLAASAGAEASPPLPPTPAPRSAGAGGSVSEGPGLPPQATAKRAAPARAHEIEAKRSRNFMA